MRVATAEEFAAAYTDYRHHDGYSRRARLLAPFPEPLIVVGCGFGYLVVELQRLGKLAHGIDTSPYCYSHRVTNDFIVHDILISPPTLAIHPGTVITEDLLPWLTDAEALITAKHCTSLSSLVLHLVTEHGQADYNYHSTGYWMALTSQLTISLEGL